MLYCVKRMLKSRCNSRTFATDSHRHAVLLTSEMAWVDQQAITLGTTGFQLMASAGQAVVAQILGRWTPRPVCILCGPGNNGGDGFVIARMLHEQGWPVRVGLLGPLSQLKGETRQHAELWPGPLETLSPDFLKGAELVVDALFGTGLSRPLSEPVTQLVRSLNAMAIPVCAVDIPSGVHGDTGQVFNEAVHADLTVTFHRKKPGQLLMPGRGFCGELIVADIGIPDQIVPGMQLHTYENHPELWLDYFPWPRADDHKYRRGHVLIRGGDVMTGAARLAAMAAARVGAGLVSVAASAQSWPIYAATLTSTLVLPCDSTEDWQLLLEDRRRNVAVLGPGAHISETLRHDVQAALQDSERIVILDAGALTAFAGHGERLFQAISGPCVLTPHGGEFDRLFAHALLDDPAKAPDGAACSPDPTSRSKLERARSAAHISGAVVVLKGHDTVIAAADGRAIVNTNAPPELATGGTGDVLAGIIAGLAAQGMDVFHATAAAVWMHGRAATLFGPGLIADDLPMMLVQVLRDLRETSRNG